MTAPPLEAPVAEPTRAMDWEGFFRRFREADFVPGYQLENKLGGGVFGEVYRARKLSIGKSYAIKFLKPADASARDDLLREIRSVEHFAQVDHPHLVSVEDRGEVLGIPYIVMNYAGDETLKTRLAEGRMPPARAYDVFRQMLEGVAALHARSLVHFDLKPANVFLKGDVARVGDYGLSKLITDSARTLSMGRGTPAYMAPEMLRRRGDARSDVYSLGAIFFEMLAGEPPFRGDSEWEVLKKHETAPVTYPDHVPPPLRAVLERALDKAPERRFADAGEMAAAFDAAVRALDSGVAHDASSRAAPTPPGAFAGAGRRIGEALGAGALTAEHTLEKVRTGVQEILHSLRAETSTAVAAARDTYRRRRATSPAAAAAAPALDALAYGLAEDAVAPPRRRGPLRRFVRLVFAPFRFLVRLFDDLVTLCMTVVLVGALCLVAEFVLRKTVG
ncbi:MAG TPA: serine/threonine-protein kinase [Planctomycetota bacterium]|nr:serine/threonine-protein kinase [Planctomycetota bacterium]